MSVKVVKSQSLHYLRREKAIQSGDLIRIGGDHGNFLIENPFKGGEGQDFEDKALYELNDFLIQIAPFVAFNLMPKRNRPDAKFDVIGSYNFSRTNANIIISNTGRSMPDEITFLGSIGKELANYIPARLHHAFMPPNVHLVNHTRIGFGDVLDHSELNNKALPTLYKSNPVSELLFWSKPTNLKFISHFIEADDAQLLLSLVSEFKPGASVGDYVIANVSSVGKRRFLSSKQNTEAFERLESELNRIASSALQANKLNVFFKKNLIGRLNQFNHTNWSFIPEPKQLVPFNIKQNVLLPSFLNNLMPEGTGEVKASEYLEFFLEEHSFIGDVCIRRLGSSNPPTSAQIHHSLGTYTDEHRVFTGMLKNIGVQYANKDQSMALKEKGYNNVISGFADKVSVTIELVDGKPTLQPSNNGDDFTHIFKFPNDVEVENLETCEWFGMHLAEKVGIPVPAFALVPNDKSVCVQDSVISRDLLDDAFDALEVGTSLSKVLYMGQEEKNEIDAGKPNYVIERFDIDDPNSSRVSISEDFASILGIQPSSKYNPHVEDIVDYIRAESTDWEGDRAYLLKALTLNMLINNNDMHAKNLSMLRVYDKDTHKLVENRLSPAYDIVAVDPHILGGRYKMSTRKHALKIEGETDYSFKNLINFAQSSLNYSLQEAEGIIESVCNCAMKTANSLIVNPPAILSEGNGANKQLSSLCHFVEENYDLHFSEHLNIDKGNIYDIPETVDEDFQMTYL